MKLTNFQQILLVIGVGLLVYFLFLRKKDNKESSYSKMRMKQKFDEKGNIGNGNVGASSRNDVFTCQPGGCSCQCATVGGKCPIECLVAPDGSVRTGPDSPQ